MADEDPTDEARAVAMTAAAAAARVTETLTREAQNRREQHTAEEVAAARNWARMTNPERLATYQQDTSPDAAQGLVSEWRDAGAPDKVRDVLTPADRAFMDKYYDSPERRAAADQAMRDAGVPDSTRQARNVADLMNGKNPALAAAEGSQTKATPSRPTRTAERQRGR